MKDPAFLWFGCLLQFVLSPRQVVSRLIHEVPGYWPEVMLGAWSLLLGIASMLFSKGVSPVEVLAGTVIALISLNIGSAMLYFGAILFGGNADFRSGKVVMTLMQTSVAILMMVLTPLVLMSPKLGMVLIPATMLYLLYLSVSAYKELLDLGLIPLLLLLALAGFGGNALEALIF